MPSPARTRTIAKNTADEKLGFENNRYVLTEYFEQAPGSAADAVPTNLNPTTAQMATRFALNRNFMLTGDTVSHAVQTFSTRGGWSMRSNNSTGDEVICHPHTATIQSAWGDVTWDTDFSLEFETHFDLPSLTNRHFYIGWRETATTTEATDDDKILVRLNAATDTNWMVLQSVAGTDTTTDTGRVATAVSSYNLKISMGANRIPKIYMNSELIYTGSAMTASVALIPTFGAVSVSNGSTSINIGALRCSRIKY